MSLVTGGIYAVHSRNLRYAVYDGNDGFTGIREKLGSRYLFTEYLRTAGSGPLGTVTPLEQVASLVPGIPLWERDLDNPSMCLDCGRRAWWTGPPGPAPWRCEGNCEKTSPVAAGANAQLYDVLDLIGNQEGLGNGLEGYGPGGIHMSLLTRREENTSK